MAFAFELLSNPGYVRVREHSLNGRELNDCQGGMQFVSRTHKIHEIAVHPKGSFVARAFPSAIGAFERSLLRVAKVVKELLHRSDYAY